MEGVYNMAQGLRSHYHQYYTLKVIKYYDKKKHCVVKLTNYECMICGKEYFKRREYKTSNKRKLRSEKDEKRTID